MCSWGRNERCREVSLATTLNPLNMSANLVLLFCFKESESIDASVNSFIQTVHCRGSSLRSYEESA